ncbi:RNA polymerase sigma factor [Pseudonocardia sp. CA-142604]|uniref:RNA polymerase sigma factor n=1 Tax=Pseudonocardia sp. CA-142604 TaxID=3240024 RepID=UPI003D8B94BD
MTVTTVTTAPATTTTKIQDLRNTELLALARQGDGSAWAEVVVRYRGLVASVVRAYRLQDADARDAEQRTWLRLVEHLGSLRDPDRLGGWLATTASRECLRILRESQILVGLEMDAVPATEPGVEEQVIDADTAARLWQIVGTLPPRGRTIMRALFADEPRPYAEVARATGIPIGSLGPSRARLIDRVRRSFDDGTYATGAQ